ncbi:hypothetical protein NOR_07590 [Metarhizium rileyi]|uniref:Uncharacterized protein n=1 Tax=Metarhizium rileyi (strain RCEF 4871) TaxID=1649241 RepID=A0A166S527_METRR|nr:hypothetical protein NOR_07590 [Metarhizium rileyi RCEF 4871]
MTTSGLDTTRIGTTVNLGSAVEGSPVDFALWCDEYGAKQDGLPPPEGSLPLDPWQTLSSQNDPRDPSSQNSVLGSMETAQTAPRHDKSVESPETLSTGHDNAMNSSAGSSSSTGSDFIWFPSAPISQGMLTAEDALLVAYYMEYVLPAQRINDGTEQHSWMQFLLLTSASVLQTTLTLAKAYRRLDICDDDVATLEIADLLRDAADGVLRIPSVLVALSIGDQERQAEQIINATSLECLQQAAAFAQPLIDLAAMNSGETADRGQATISALHMYTAAAKALVGQLVWFDIVGAVSTGSRLQLAIDYDGLFASNTLSVGGALGCRKDIVALFHQILCLRHWKLELERGKRLNVMELATKGCRILQSLEDITARIDNPVLTTTDEANAADSINLAFASTAVIYLHTVISGPILHLKEIRSETMRLGHLLRELAKSQDIGFVLLPVCMAACFWPQEDGGELGNMLLPKQRDIPGVGMRSRTSLMAALEMGRLALRHGGQGEWALAGQYNRALLLG